MNELRTVVIPAAGLGTRLLPATKTVPKELLPVGDRPAIHHAVAEAVAAGFDDIVLVTNGSKRTVVDYFRRQRALERALSRAGNDRALAAIRHPAGRGAVRVVHQHAPLGLGHAIALTRRAVGANSFAVVLPDELLLDGGALLARLRAHHIATGRSSVGVVEVDPDTTGRYGCVALADGPGPPADDASAGPREVTVVVERPPAGRAPSNLALCGRYVLTPAVFDCLDRARPDGSGELSLAPALAAAASAGRLDALTTGAPRFDLGDPTGYLLANLELALEDPRTAPALRARLADLGGGDRERPALAGPEVGGYPQPVLRVV